MWEIEPHLQKGEKIKYQGTQVWIGYLGTFIVAFLFIWTIIIPILLILFAILNKYSTKYVITNKRVAGRFGVLSEDFKSASFKHITSVRSRQGVFGKIFNFGTLVIDTSGTASDTEFVWKRVKDPVKVKNMIEEKVD